MRDHLVRHRAGPADAEPRRGYQVTECRVVTRAWPACAEWLSGLPDMVLGSEPGVVRASPTRAGGGRRHLGRDRGLIWVVLAGR
jgi:hypothetical protein